MTRFLVTGLGLLMGMTVVVAQTSDLVTLPPDASRLEATTLDGLAREADAIVVAVYEGSMAALLTGDAVQARLTTTLDFRLRDTIKPHPQLAHQQRLRIHAGEGGQYLRDARIVVQTTEGARGFTQGRTNLLVLRWRDREQRFTLPGGHDAALNVTEGRPRPVWDPSPAFTEAARLRTPELLTALRRAIPTS